jgi:TP901 family phage tail tape measure protein
VRPFSLTRENGLFMSSKVEIWIEGHDGASQLFENVSRALEGLNSPAKLAAVAVTAIGAAVLAAGAASVASAANFQQYTQNIANNTTMTQADLQHMRETVLRLSSDSGASLETLSTGYMKIVNVTGDAARAQDILTVANESAVSTGGDVASVAAILSNGMHEYGLDVSHAATETQRHTDIQQNAARVMGIYHLAAAEGNMTLEQFADSSGRAIGLAANLNVPLEDVSAAYAALTKHGYDAAESGTQVTNIMTHLIHPSKQATQELQRLSKVTGVDLVSDFSAAGLAHKGLHGIVEDLRTAYGKMGLSEADVTGETMKLLNAQRGGLGMASLLGTAYGDYNSILGDVSDKQKVMTVTEEAYAKTQQTLAFQWGVVKASIGALAIEIGTRALPALSNFLQTAIIPAIQWVSNFANIMLTSQHPLATFRQILIDTVPGFAWINQAVQKLLPVFGLLSAVVTNIANAFLHGGLIQGFSTLLVTIQYFGAQLLGWIQAQIPAIQAKLVAWAARFVAWVGPMIPPALAALEGYGLAVYQWIAQKATALAGQLLAWGRGFSSWVQPMIPPAIAALEGYALRLWGWIQEKAALLPGQLAQWGQQFATFITPYVAPMLAQAEALAARLWTWIQVKAGELPGKLLAWGEQFVAWVAPMIPKAIAAIEQFGQRFLTWVGQQAAPILAKLQTWAASLVAWIVPATERFLQQWPGMLNRFLDWVGNAAGPILAKLGDWAVAFVAWILPMIPPFLAGLAGVAAALIVFVGETAGVLLNKLNDTWVPAFADWVKVALPKLATALGTLLTSLMQWCLDAGTALHPEVVKIGDAIVAGIRAGVSSAWAGFSKWLHDQVMKIPEVIRKFMGITSPSRLMASEVGGHLERHRREPALPQLPVRRSRPNVHRLI